jgi:hypothetical protein
MRGRAQQEAGQSEGEGGVFAQHGEAAPRSQRVVAYVDWQKFSQACRGGKLGWHAFAAPKRGKTPAQTVGAAKAWHAR